jgi:hypothetical protein
MKEAAGCCMTDLHQSNEGDSYLSALLEGDFWRFIGEHGVFRAAEIKKKTLLLRRNEL